MCTCYPPSLPEILSLVFLQAIVLPQYLAPWSYFYNRPGTVDLDIPMLNDFVVGTSRATAKIALGRRDHWKTLGEGHGRELAVLSGSIRGVVIYHGIRCAFLWDACYTTETGTDICRAQWSHITLPSPLRLGSVWDILLRLVHRTRRMSHAGSRMALPLRARRAASIGARRQGPPTSAVSSSGIHRAEREQEPPEDPYNREKDGGQFFSLETIGRSILAFPGVS